MKTVAFRTSELDAPAIYRLLTGLVLPRPIAFVSTVSPDGVPNLAPFSFFTVASADPPVLAISIDLRYGHETKDTLSNIATSGEFVVNIASENLAESVNTASLDWAPDIDEFEKAGLTAVRDNLVVKPPRVAESPAQFECRHLQNVEFGKWTLVLGEVVAIRCREDLLDARLRVDVAALNPLGRLAGNDYCRVGDRFTVERAADSPGLMKASTNK
ncbi:MAG: flavin reductase family protein [Betaproteobacteria bacterium]|jgi:flavin reductase (DIM6/NTAB) family NADH-FMN oxidoreductase RutF